MSYTSTTELTQYIKQDETKSCWEDCGLVKRFRANSTNIYQCLNKFYDVATAVLSCIDLVTDVLVMIDYYNKGYSAFFYISLIVISFAQLSYGMIDIDRNCIFKNLIFFCLKLK